MVTKFFMGFLLTLANLFPLSAQTPPPAAEEQVIPSVIIGGGVGGGTAAIYLGRAHFKPLVLQGMSPGGALAQSDSVENWPGAMKIQGADLMERIRKQAEANGAEFLNEEVVSVDFSKKPFVIVSRSLDQPAVLKTRKAASCIIATGSKPNFLGIPGEKHYWGRGVSNCAICDGSLYEGKRVGIVGGGDSAVLEALYLSNIAKEVDLFVRADHFRATDEARKATLLALPNVKVHYKSVVEAVKGGDEGVTSVALNENGAQREVPLDGLFLAIGSTPNTALFKEQLELDKEGYIVLKQGQQTSIEGVYAIGDAVDPLFKQAISAAGDGAKAALAIQTKLSATAPQLLAAYQSGKAVLEKKSSAEVVEITTAEQFETELKESGVTIVADFYATWCPPCKRIAPEIASSAANLAGKVKFLKINVDVVKELTKTYNIKSMPTVIRFEKGEAVERKVGETQIKELLSQLGSK